MAGLELVVKLARELGSAFRLNAVRLDSGDLASLARAARRKLDEAGLRSVRIFASGGLGEDTISDFIETGVPIDAFGVGTEMGVSSDAPSLDLAYKLVSYAGTDRVKLSPDKRVLPGRKQIFRVEQEGRALRDLIARSDEPCEGRPLLVPVMQGGRRLAASGETIAAARKRAAAETALLPPHVRGLPPADPSYRVDLSPTLQRRYHELAAAHGAPWAPL